MIGIGFPAAVFHTVMNSRMGPVSPSSNSASSRWARRFLRLFRQRRPGTISRNDAFWKRIDEHCVDVATVENLAKNGFRVGLAPLTEWEHLNSLIQQNPDIPDILHRVLDGVLGVLRWYLQPISEVPPRFNCIEAETITKLLAQLAHMALDYALVERGFEDAVDRIEDLRLREPFPVVANHILDDAQFAARQGKGTAADFRIAPVKEDPDAAFAWAREIPKAAASDCRSPRENLAKMNRNMHYIVHPGFEKLQCVLEHF